ncbi:hypothetical protein KJ980_02020 [Patescibacteria group bacterium]|nr:hypothetical protein [Patescibacteria group bacterium]MBU4016906.1 hypothetical protein [Patescibacteria group bacterium]MBU4098406.1 hypothetical protein [Patescibacteria group bacterium]
MILFFKKYKYIFFLIIIALISHLQWFNPFSILNSSDWSYWPDKAVSQLYYSWGAWINFFNFGAVNIQLSFNFFKSIWSLFTNLGFSYDLATKVTFLIPIAILGFISPYILFRKLTKDELISFIIALFYGTTTYFLVRQTAHMPIAFVYALTPLIFYFFIIALERNKLLNWLIFSLLYWISICYEIRIALIVTFILFIYFLFFHIFNIIKYWKNILLSSLFLFGLNIFWIFPVLFGGFSEDIFLIANRGLFGNFLFDLGHAFALSNDPWTGSKPNNQFIIQPIFWYFWVIPIIAFSSFLLRRNNKYKKEVIFFGILSLIGVFLTKQATEPISGAYLWLYNNFPGFNLFREASKFYLLIAIGYSGLIAYGLLLLQEHKNKFINRYLFLTFVSILIAIFFWNMKPLITGEVETIFIPKHIPNDYIILKDFILKQSDYFRTFWTPSDSRWSIFTNQKPKISNVSVIGSAWKNILEMNESEKLIQNRIIDVFKLPSTNNLFDISSIKYVIVPLQDKANDDDFFIHYGGRENSNIREWYISELDKSGLLEKINIGTKELVVYENKDYKPHISSLNNVYSFISIGNLNQKYDFINNVLKNEFSFVTSNKNNNLTVLSNLFESVKSSDISDKMKNEFELANQNSVNTIYDNKSKTSLYYSFNQKNQYLNLYKKDNDNLFVNGEKINQDLGTEFLYQKILSPDKKYYLNFGTKLIPLEKNENQKLGTINQNIQIPIYSTDGQNLIPNASFQDGLWDQKVGDCNAYDNNPILDIKLGTEPKNNINLDNINGGNVGVVENNQYLQLEAVRHIACTTNLFDVQENKDYLFSFDYQSPNAKNAGYYLAFNDDAKTVVSERIFVKDQDWQTYSRKIKSPAGATSARLYLYAYSVDETTNIINRYDNFSLLKLDHEDEVKIEYQPEFEKQEISLQKENIFEYSDPDFKFENNILNGSFENGLWQEKVGDCHNYDNKGDLGMKVGNVASEGSKSLQLEARRHSACTGTSFSVNENSVYLISFDYQSPNSKTAGYYLSFNDKNKTVISERLDIENQNWQKFEKKIRIPMGTTSVSIAVYAYESDGKTNNIVRYDNFKFVEIPDLEDKYYLVSDPQLNLKNPKSIKFNLVNPTKKIVHVKGATTPFFLAMSESYHPQWKLEMNNSKAQGILNSWIPFVSPDKISDDNHLKLNDFLNAWYVDVNKLCKKEGNGCTKNPDGSYDIELVIEFFPQRWFYLGLLISGITLISCLGYLIYDWRKRKTIKKLEI